MLPSHSRSAEPLTWIEYVVGTGDELKAAKTDVSQGTL
jgi:hypothetical protein